MTGKIHYQFSAHMWQHSSPGGWFFVSLPEDISSEIRENLQWQEEGWGRMKASARVQDIIWDTAIWFDKKKDTYLLPIKADIRKKAKLNAESVLSVDIYI